MEPAEIQGCAATPAASIRGGGWGCERQCKRRSHRAVGGGALGTAGGALTGTANMLTPR